MRFMRQTMLGLVCGALTLSAAIGNLLDNGDFQGGVKAFRTVKTWEPSGSMDKVVRVVKDASGRNMMRLRLAPDTSKHFLIVQPIPMERVKGIEKLGLRCRIRICPDSPGTFEGSVFLRLRQWKKGKVTNRCGLWLPFSSKRGLRGNVDRFPEISGSFLEKPVKGEWHELMGTGVLDQATTGLDFTIHGGAVKGDVTIEITDLAVVPVNREVCRLVRRPGTVMQGQSTLPLRLQINQPAEVAYSLLQHGKVVGKGAKRLPVGEQALSVPLGNLEPGDFELKLSSGSWHEHLKIELEEDPFAE